MDVLKIIETESGDWTVAIFNGTEIYSGHDGWSALLSEVCRKARIRIISEFISQEEMESGNF